MLAAVVAATLRSQPTPFVAVVVDSDHRDRFSDHKRVRRELDPILERLPQSPELFAVPMGIDQRSFQQLFHGPVHRERLTSCHGLLRRILLHHGRRLP